MSLKIRSPKQFKTFFDDEGRVCTSCNIYKIWEDFPKYKKSASGRVSRCKKCFSEKRAANRNWPKEKYSAKNRRKEIKKQDAILLMARNSRSRLLSRARKDNFPKESVPTIDQIYALFSSSPTCYYSNITLVPYSKNRQELPTIDHKLPISRGGTHLIDNLCVASHHMNTAKGQMTELEFKALLNLILTWEDRGEKLLNRLKQGHF